MRSEQEQVVARNRKARHDYEIEETWEAGLVLTGTEVKALRAGRCSLTDGFADVEAGPGGGEVWLHQVHIPEYAQGTWTNHAVRRKRKLLLNRREISRIERRLEAKGTTLVPLSVYFSGGRAKVEIALARGKRDYDKRRALAEREASREIEREFSHRMKRRTG
ncbi:SsrA-binding protein SmpB [Nocardioides aequoreus]|uniref:SsrA-binding protein SmpB n=1 Tax=Nocardioides aequoreus TaxID=397278 RepID=UPI0004C3D659|nr:SsrA-binding protein SmpB [Nocardioides aequoreus]